MALAADIHHLGLEAHHGELQDKLTVRHFDSKMTVKISHRTDLRTGYDHSCPYRGFVIRAVDDLSCDRRLRRQEGTKGQSTKYNKLSVHIIVQKLVLF